MLYYFLKLVTTLTYAASCGPQEGGGYILCTKIPGAPAIVAGPVGYLTVIYKYSLGVVGLVGFGLLVWSGINYIFQRSNYAKLADIKDHITQIVFGIILLVFASVLLNEINPNILTNLKSGEEFQIDKINRDSLTSLYTSMTAAQRAELDRQLSSIRQHTLTPESIRKVDGIYQSLKNITYDIDRKIEIERLFNEPSLSDVEKIYLRSLMTQTADERKEITDVFTGMDIEKQTTEINRLISIKNEATAAAYFTVLPDERKLELFNKLSQDQQKAIITSFDTEPASVNALAIIYKRTDMTTANNIIKTLANPDNGSPVRGAILWQALNNTKEEKEKILATNFADQLGKQFKETENYAIQPFLLKVKSKLNDKEYSQFLKDFMTNNNIRETSPTVYGNVKPLK